VPALMAIRVVPIVMHDVTPQVVVIGVNPGHDVKSGTGEDANPARRGRETGRPRSERWPNNLATHSDDRTCAVAHAEGLVLGGFRVRIAFACRNA